MEISDHQYELGGTAPDLEQMGTSRPGQLASRAAFRYPNKVLMTNAHSR